MTGKVDITAPVLPKVAEPDLTHPALPSVKETVAALEPVEAPPVSTASTLELDPQEDVITDERPIYRPRSVRAQRHGFASRSTAGERGPGLEGSSLASPARSAETRMKWVVVALLLAALAIFVATRFL